MPPDERAEQIVIHKEMVFDVKKDMITERDLFCCPITGSVMHDPVITRWGNNFERSAIMKAVEDTGLDPVAKKPIRDLRPGREISENASLRRAILVKYGGGDR